jgi:pyruvate, orthophosphate dikinase
MQDFEFTVERGRLYLLQTRSGYRSPLAAVRIAVDLVEEGPQSHRPELSLHRAECGKSTLYQRHLPNELGTAPAS